MFGKPGRPPQDIWERRREIYNAVSPLLLEVGARRLTMRQAAKAAYLSIGGLYYYFPDKTKLVLHGLHPQALKSRCLQFFENNNRLAKQDPQAYFVKFVDFAIEAVEFIRPSVFAALELGKTTFLDTITSSVHMPAKEFRKIKHSIMPDVDDETLDHLEITIRRFLIAACLDKRISIEESRSEIINIFRGLSNASSNLYTVSLPMLKEELGVDAHPIE